MLLYPFKYLNFKLEGFWIVVGLLFIIGGIGELVHIEIDLFPILLIAAGIVILISVFRGKKNICWKGKGEKLNEQSSSIQRGTHCF